MRSFSWHCTAASIGEVTPGIFALLESEIYGVSAPNQGALERFTFGGDLLCDPPASNDAESSSNHVLFWVCKFGVEFDNAGENSGPLKSWPVNSLGLNGIRLQRRPLMPIVSIAKLVLNEMVLCTGVHYTAHLQYILEKRLDTTQLSS